MTSINPPLEPDVTDPGPAPKLSGDWEDDDGSAIDEQFEAPSHEPLDYDVLIRDDIADALVQPTRLIVRTITLIGGNDPYQILTPDVNRLQLQVKFTATDKGSQLHIGSEKSDVYGTTGLPLMLPAATGYVFSDWLNLDAHTGALWVYPDPTAGTAGDTFTIWVTAVTR